MLVEIHSGKELVGRTLEFYLKHFETVLEILEVDSLLQGFVISFI